VAGHSLRAAEVERGVLAQHPTVDPQFDVGVKDGHSKMSSASGRVSRLGGTAAHQWLR
jgi:hypothetical protein